MPPRKLTSKTGQKHEMEAFAERYDTLALIYGDPVDVCFQIMARSFNPGLSADGNPIAPNDELAKQTADMLMSYRFPRVKASEMVKQQGTPLQFNVIMQGASPSPPTIEIRPPARPVLTLKTEET